MKILISQVRTSTLYKLLWPRIKKANYPISERDFAMALRQVFNDPDVDINYTLKGDKPAGYSDRFYFLTMFNWSETKQGYDFWERIYQATCHESIQS